MNENKNTTNKQLDTIKVTLTKSLIGRLQAHKCCARGLGLRRIGQTVEVSRSPEFMGMIKRINYLLNIHDSD